MIELLAFISSILSNVVLGFLLWHEQRDRALERKERDLKEIGLLNRIQAPEVELARQAPEPSDGPVYVSPEDDKAWEQYLEDRAAGEVN